MPQARHKLIVETARGMAREVYVTMARKSDAWYAGHQDEEGFVEKVYPTLINQARTTLAQLLGTTSNEELKAEIYDALVKDNELARGKAQPRRRLWHP